MRSSVDWMLTMSASYLIDGYNLIHAMGLLPGRAGPGGLLKARLGLLGLLKGSLGSTAGGVTVVFDGSRAPAGVAPVQDYQGIEVRFAQGQQQADDLIEEIISHSGAPKSLTVVSDDRRLQLAARRRRARALGCADFLEYLQRCRKPARPAKEEKPLSEKEIGKWRAAFGDMEKDPEFKDLFDRFGE